VFLGRHVLLEFGQALREVHKGTLVVLGQGGELVHLVEHGGGLEFEKVVHTD